MATENERDSAETTIAAIELEIAKIKLEASRRRDMVKHLLRNADEARLDDNRKLEELNDQIEKHTSEIPQHAGSKPPHRHVLP